MPVRSNVQWSRNKTKVGGGAHMLIKISRYDAFIDAIMKGVYMMFGTGQAKIWEGGRLTLAPPTHTHTFLLVQWSCTVTYSGPGGRPCFHILFVDYTIQSFPE